MGSVKMIPSSSSIHLNNQEEFSKQWALISSFTLWHIWVARRCHRLEQEVIPPEITIRNEWTDLIHTVKGQFDGFKDMTLKTLCWLNWLYVKDGRISTCFLEIG